MKTTRWFPVLTFAVASTTSAEMAQTLYLDGRVGNDTNPATAERPLRTLAQAVAAVNAKTGPGPMTIRLAPGVFPLPETLALKNNHAFGSQYLLTLEAAVLPDDPDWSPGLMPILLSTEDPRRPGEKHGTTQTFGLKIQMSHVTVRGLKFLGSPLPNNWYCPLECLASNLTDVVVTQCLFQGDPHTLDIYCGVIFDGHRCLVDHCIFSGCHACAVFWDGDRGVVGKGNAMRYCIVDGAKISGVWTCETDEDFEFHHNIVLNSEYFWMRKRGPPRTYRLRDCVVSGNQHYSGYGVASGATGQSGAEIKFVEQSVTKDEAVTLQRNRDSKDYLHVVPGTAVSQLRAGLFQRERARD